MAHDDHRATDARLATKALLALTGAESPADFIGLEMPNGDIKPFRFHLCCYSRNPYLMVAAPPIEDGIYLLAVVTDLASESVELVGWDWAQKVRAQPYTTAAIGGIQGHAIPRRYLRKMAELRRRLVGPMPSENRRTA